MVKLKQSGAVNGVVIISIVLGLASFAFLLFGIWAFTSRQDYKNNADEKAAVAAAAAKQEAEAAKDAEHAEADKQPTKTFQASETYGSLSFNYPKTWSTFLDTTTTSAPLNATLHPDAVSNEKDKSHALRVQVADIAYEKAVEEFDSDIEDGIVTSAPYVPKQVSSELGLRLSGEIVSKKSGVMVLLPLRDKTIKIWTENPAFVADLDSFVLETLKYQP